MLNQHQKKPKTEAITEGRKEFNLALARLEEDPNHTTMEEIMQEAKDFIEKNKNTWQK